MPNGRHSLVDSLVALGFRPNEALVYAALVEIGPCFVAPLVRRTKKHRQIVYNALDTRARRHLVTVGKKRGKNFYSLGDPRGLVADLKQREALATAVAERVERRLKTAGERVDVFSGPDSFANGLADFRRRAEEAGEYTVIGGEPEDWFTYMRSVFAAHVEEVRRLKRLGIPVRILFFETERASALKHIGPLVGDPYTLKISAARPKLPHTAWLAGDHVYILTPTADPLVVHIQSPPLAREYRRYFETLWRDAELIRKTRA
jgi:sugar-specific transcriptional regulator TrmB